MKTKTKTEKEKKPNKLDKLVLNITEPFKMDSEITLEQLSVFVGPNSSGKSFMLKVAYALGATGLMRLAPPNEISAAQFVFDNTFTAQKFNGLFKAIYAEGSVSVDLKDGTVEKVEIEGNTVPVTFMSTDLRTFQQMGLYLQLRKAAISDPLTFMKKMLEVYRLYDFSYMEGLLGKLPFVLPDSAKDYLKLMDFPGDVVSVEVDTDKCEFYAVPKEKERVNIATLGNGHQAILNMMLGSFMS